MSKVETKSTNNAIRKVEIIAMLLGLVVNLIALAGYLGYTSSTPNNDLYSGLNNVHWLFVFIAICYSAAFINSVIAVKKCEKLRQVIDDVLEENRADYFDDWLKNLLRTHIAVSILTSFPYLSIMFASTDPMNGILGSAFMGAFVSVFVSVGILCLTRFMLMFYSHIGEGELYDEVAAFGKHYFSNLGGFIVSVT